MDPAVAEPIAALLATFALGIMVLIGTKIRYDAKLRMRGDREGDGELHDAITELHREVRQLREKHLELQERLDFTERVLAKALPRPDTEQPSTPV